MAWIFLFLVGFFAGALTGSALLIKALSYFFSAIPVTFELTRQGVFVRPNPIVRWYAISATLLLFVFFGISIVTFIFFSTEVFIGYVIGISWILVFGLRYVRWNKNNINDLIKENIKYTDKKYHL